MSANLIFGLVIRHFAWVKRLQLRIILIARNQDENEALMVMFNKDNVRPPCAAAALAAAMLAPATALAAERAATSWRLLLIT